MQHSNTESVPVLQLSEHARGKLPAQYQESGDTSLVRNQPFRLNNREWESRSEVPEMHRRPTGPNDGEAWDNTDGERWPHCPRNIPDLWKTWWFAPVLGSPQARMRAEFALSLQKLPETPVPYESLDSYLGRMRKETAREPDTRDIWVQFMQMYPPWATVEGDMPLSTGFLRQCDVESFQPLLDAYASGTSWTDLPAKMPHCPSPAVAQIMYLKVIRELVPGNHLKTEKHDLLSKATAEWAVRYGTYKLAKAHNAPWTPDEEAVLEALRSYGFSYYAISAELERRSPYACWYRARSAIAPGQAVRGAISSLVVDTSSLRETRQTGLAETATPLALTAAGFGRLPSIGTALQSQAAGNPGGSVDLAPLDSSNTVFSQRGPGLLPREPEYRGPTNMPQPDRMDLRFTDDPKLSGLRGQHNPTSGGSRSMR